MSDQKKNLEEERNQLIITNRMVEKPIRDELATIGIYVNSISDLYNQHMNYQKAIPLLINWLPLIDNFSVRESIVRALSVPWAKGTRAPELLLDLFKDKTIHPGLRWAIGNALSVIVDENHLPEIRLLVQNKYYGTARQMLVVSLGNMKSDDVDDLLIGLLSDDDVTGQAVIALGKLKSRKALPYLETLLQHKKTWVRAETKKAIKKIENSKLNQ